MAITFPYSPTLLSTIQKLPDRVFDKKNKFWKMPVIDLFILIKILKQDGYGANITKKAKAHYLEVISRYEANSTLSQLTDVDYEPRGMNIQMYKFQKVAANYLNKVENAILGLDLGLGKFQFVDSTILTPSGWMRMGDVKVGDEIFGSDGMPHRVVRVFPQGLKDCYEITFTDDSKTTSGEEHLWNIQSPCQKLRSTGFKTKQLKEFKDDLYEKSGNTKWFIPITKSVNFKGTTLAINPYVLGALIGDGSLHGKTPGLTSADPYIVNEIKEILKNKCELRKGERYAWRIISLQRDVFNLAKEISDLGLNVLSYEKFIPNVYKFASIEQRVAILQGLMDTDGGVDSKDGVVITYTSTSERLANDVQFIVESLGGTARKSSRITQYTYKGIKKNGRRAYRLNINLPPSIEPFRLPRKLASYTPRSKYGPRRGVKSVEYIGKKECQCIEVDAKDGLYLTNHCIVTHNSPTSMASASDSIIDLGYKKNLIIVPASLKYGWAIELAKFSNYSYTVVAGDAKLRKKLYHNTSNFTIVNYDVIWRDLEMFKDIEWDLVLADEIQRIKNHKTAAHKTINKISCKRKVGLTGTVLENGLMDLFNVMKFINRDIFGANAMTFKARYCELDGWGNIVGYKNLDEIVKKLSYVMLRRRKRDVLDDLPEKTIKDVYIDFSDTERRVYNEIKNGILADYKSGKIRKIDILTRIIYLRQVCDCLNLVQDGPKIISSKLDELVEILEELRGEKIVIFSEYERMTKILAEKLKFKSVRLHGGVKNDCKWEKEIEKAAKIESKDLTDTKRDLFIHERKLTAICGNCPYYKNDADCLTRKKIIYQFINDPSVEIFISTNAGKEGLNLQVGSVLVNYDKSFNPATNEQRIARIDRIGQKSDKILVINLHIRNSVDEKVKNVSDDKQALFDLIVDGINEGTDPKISKDIDLDNIEDLL